MCKIIIANSCRRCNMQQWDLLACWWRSVRESQTTWLTQRWCACANFYTLTRSASKKIGISTCVNYPDTQQLWKAVIKMLQLLTFLISQHGGVAALLKTLPSALKQKRIPLSLRICALHFSSNIRINYELITITLWRGYFKTLSTFIFLPFLHSQE